MKSFVVIGLDQFGINVALTLQELGHEVLGIDNNPDNVRAVSDIITHAAIGDPLDENVLLSLGVKNFDCAVVSLSQDMQSGILVTLSLKEIGVKFVVSKAHNDIHERVLSKVGADRIIYPEKDMGKRVAQSLSMTNIVEYIQLSDKYSIIEIIVPQKWASRSLRDLNVRKKYKINIIAIKHKSGEINIAPDPDSPLLETDILVIVGNSKNVTKAFGKS